MKSNPFYIIWGIVSLLFVGGAGFFMFSSKSAYNDVKGSFENKEISIERLQKKKPYPNAGSVKSMEEMVTDYQSAVDDLYSALVIFQRPLRTDLRDDDFQKLVRDKLDAFFAAAKAADMAIKGRDSFYFGMDRYRETLPSPKNVPLLDYQMEAIDRLLQIMVESGVEELLDLQRELLATEVAPNDPDPNAGQSVVRYELRVEFVSSFDAFQKFVNALANDKKFFYLLRVIRVDNSSPNGAAGTDGPVTLGGDLEFQNVAGESPSPELRTQAEAIESIEERVAFYQARGYSVVGQDARILFGDERVRVFAVIDVARFPTPKEQNDNGGDAADSADSK